MARSRHRSCRLPGHAKIASSQVPPESRTDLLPHNNLMRGRQLLVLSQHVYRIDRPLHIPAGLRSQRSYPKPPLLPSQLSRIGSILPCVSPSAPNQPRNSPRRRPGLMPLSAWGGRRGFALRSSTAIMRRVMTRGRCGSSCRVSSARRRIRGGFVTIGKSSETPGFSRKRHKHQAETSESSGKPWLTGSQESPHLIARQPGRRESERLSFGVDSPMCPCRNGLVACCGLGARPGKGKVPARGTRATKQPPSTRRV